MKHPQQESDVMIDHAIDMIQQYAETLEQWKTVCVCRCNVVAGEYYVKVFVPKNNNIFDITDYVALVGGFEFAPMGCIVIPDIFKSIAKIADQIAKVVGVESLSVKIL